MEEYKEEKEQYKKALIENKNLSEENYELKGQVMSYKNDNVILIKKMKKYDEEKEKREKKN